jgi:ribosome biogenesis GTPase
VPVVVLNKVDLSARSADELEGLTSELSARLSGPEVLCVSARTGHRTEQLQRHLPPGDTVAFIGLSGVGKSSLINALLGETRVPVAAVREEDGKGRHTTSRRELLVMPSGALLIDTPGMRQFAVLCADGSVPGFDDIDELASACRFADCEHGAEPDCAVQAAVARGALSPDRLRSYRSIKQDAQRLRARHDGYARHQEHQAAKRFGRMCRRVTAPKRR